MRTRAPALLIAGLAVAACGKYGPPVRSRTQAPLAAPAKSALGADSGEPTELEAAAESAPAPDAASVPPATDSTETPQSTREESQP
jgi:hypothetical protein